MSDSLVQRETIYKYGYRVDYIYHRISPEEEKKVVEELKELISKSLIRNAYEQKTRGIKQKSLRTI